jgi:hypothetical protein
MSRNVLASTTAIIAAAMVLYAPHARASDTDDLRRQISELNAKMESLQAKAAELEGKQAATQVAVKEAAKEAAAKEAAPTFGAGSFPGSFKIPGTNSSMKIGGYVKLDMYEDLYGANANGSTINMATIAIKGTPQAQRKAQFGATARQSRLNIETRTPTNMEWGDVKAVIEGDFLGADSTTLETHSAALRLRHLYGEWGPVLAGQYWSNFFDLAMGPETIEFNGPVGIASGLRQPQLRYTTPMGEKGKLAVAIESPAADCFGCDLSSLGTNGSTLTTRSMNKAPDVTGRYSYTGSWGQMSAGAVVRSIGVDTGGTSQSFQGPNGSFNFNGKRSGIGYGGEAAVQFKTFDKDTITFAAIGGPGIGRYIVQSLDSNLSIGVAPNGLTNTNTGDSFVLDSNGGFHAVNQYGGNIWYRHYWTDTLRSNASYGIMTKNLPMQYLPANFPQTVQSIHTNLIWSPIPAMNIGLEYIWGNVGLAGQTTANTAAGYGTSGSMSRIQAAFQYMF